MITFIIPTIGRHTLIHTIESLYNQTNKEWRANIIFDGIPCTIDKEALDHRIRVVEIDKKGVHINSAGLVRNIGITNCITDWVAFVDDDDILSSRYVETFYDEIKKYTDISVIIFRMFNEKPKGQYSYNNILPGLITDNFYHQQTGISFVLKTTIFLEDDNWFIPSEEEDYLLLHNLRNKGYKIMISPYIRYFVEPSNMNVLEEFTTDLIVGNRVLI